MAQKRGLAVAAEILRKGATLLKEPCPKCGGVQIRYKNRTLCTNCDDLSNIEALEAPQPTEVIGKLKDLIAAKIGEASLLLKEEKNIERQTQLAALLLRYVELMEKTSTILEKEQP
ncbi:MAG: hypothetical protein HYU39_07300 [Thaumarchaeota archaeon]|nr:hypothetical protein [Nitrososphaerota archaeon]